MTKSPRKRFGLRAKLTLTYTLVTVAALMALELVIMLMFLAAFTGTKSDKTAYVSDVIYTLAPQAEKFLRQEPPDQEGLQAWLESVYASGYASLEPLNFTDSPVAPIVQDSPMFVLSRSGEILAEAPAGTGWVGRQYTPPDADAAQKAVSLAYKNTISPARSYTETSDGHYFVSFPIQNRETGKLLGVIVLNIETPPPVLVSAGPALLAVLLGTGCLMAMAVAPFGALFGFVMSRGLTRRLENLTGAVDAWSEGDFDTKPGARRSGGISAGDEIDYLAVRMEYMAEQVQALMQTQQELASLEERSRLARDLHDSVKQGTFATLMQVRAAKNLAESDPQAARERLNEAEALLKTAQKELNLIIAELRPAALEGRGLVAALQAYLQSWSTNAGIASDLQVQDERALPLRVEQALYRLAQEALANVARHSRAENVRLLLAYESSQVKMEIEDNGCGFDLEQVSENGFGLVSMQQRAAELDGWMTVQSQPGKGTTLAINIPV